ncbi:MAG: hypothetical protein ACI9A2_004691 [Halioglobus sp.]
MSIYYTNLLGFEDRGANFVYFLNTS